METMLGKFVTAIAMTTMAFSALTGCASEIDGEGSIGDIGAEVDGDIGESADAWTGVWFDHFRFGSASGSGERTATNADFYRLAGWVVPSASSEPFNSGLLAELRTIAATKTPFVTFYIGASMAKQAWGLRDCNVAGSDPNATLCIRGAEYVRANRAAIIAKHVRAAQQVQSVVGDRRTLIHVEPDWYQYTQASQRSKLSFVEAGDIMDGIINGIKTSCASCAIVLDVSFWGEKLPAYFAQINMSNVFMLGITGAPFSPTKGWIDNYRYADMRQLSGKKLIIDNGGLYDPAWVNEANVEAMWNSGVAGVILSNANRTDYMNRINYFRANPVTNGNGGATTGWAFQPMDWGLQSWWKELRVGAQHGVEVTQVDAQNATGATAPLGLRAANTWGGSVFGTTGRVRFIAVDRLGRQSTSGWYDVR